jgi:hypothetical protein
LLANDHRKNGLLFVLAAITSILPALPTRAQEKAERQCTVIVIAFVGGIGTAHFPPSVAVPLFRRLKSRHYQGVCIKEVSAYCPWCAYHWVRREFAVKAEGPLTEAELENGPKVILYGYSLGAPSALSLARKLEKDSIPIALAITVDSKGFTRGIIPRNIKVAANFYESGFLPPVAGKRNMRPEDPLATNFLGNIRVEHVGHLRIAGSPPVQQLLISMTHALAYEGQNVAAELDDLP